MKKKSYEKILLNYDNFLVLKKIESLTQKFKLLDNNNFKKVNYNCFHAENGEIDTIYVNFTHVYMYKGYKKYRTINDQKIIRLILKLLCRLDKLKILDLCNNRIEELPFEIHNFNCLKYLDLSQNYIEILPTSLFQLKSIENLILNANHIKNIPKSIKKLLNLKYLDLSYNSIKEIPKDILFPNSLEELQLHENEIEKFPFSVLKINNLKKINIYDNPFYFRDEKEDLDKINFLKKKGVEIDTIRISGE